MSTIYTTSGDDLTSIANAIRTKGGTSASLSYPTDFVTAINNIPSGGGTVNFSVNDGGTGFVINVGVPSGATCTPNPDNPWIYDVVAPAGSLIVIWESVNSTPTLTNATQSFKWSVGIRPINYMRGVTLGDQDGSAEYDM